MLGIDKVHFKSYLSTVRFIGMQILKEEVIQLAKTLRRR